MTDEDRIKSAQEALDSIPDRSETAEFHAEATGPVWTDRDLQEQFKRATEQGWLAYFTDAAAANGFKSSLLLAIGSRESNVAEIVGDHRHGYGIMQIDIRYYPDFVNSGQWRDPQLDINMGAEVLATASKAIKNGEGLSLHYKDRQNVIHPFTGASLDEDELLRTTIAAYNSGATAAYYWMSEEANPDKGTTGGNYAADVLMRAARFERLLTAPSS